MKTHIFFFLFFCIAHMAHVMHFTRKIVHKLNSNFEWILCNIVILCLKPPFFTTIDASVVHFGVQPSFFSRSVSRTNSVAAHRLAYDFRYHTVRERMTKTASQNEYVAFLLLNAFYYITGKGWTGTKRSNVLLFSKWLAVLLKAIARFISRRPYTIYNTQLRRQ